MLHPGDLAYSHMVRSPDYIHDEGKGLDLLDEFLTVFSHFNEPVYLT